MIPEQDLAIARRRMVERHVLPRGIKDPRVIDALLRVPRHLFVPEALQNQAYGDYPLPIGNKQTISQPYMVAAMTEALQLTGSETVLEIGTGSGYQTAILAMLARRVFTLERIGELARQARRVLDQLGFATVNLRVTDGTLGWEEKAPFDAILVTAGAPEVPQTYVEQLAPGGRLVIPVGDRETQTLCRITKTPEGRLLRKDLFACRFVPLIGQEGWRNGEAG